MQETGIGIIGCGFISEIYLKNLACFDGVAVRAVADLDKDRAQAMASAFQIPHCLSTIELLNSDEVDLVLNLTPPGAHHPVAMTALEHGKSVYSEKPLGLTRDEGTEILHQAEVQGLFVGSAPDTFLGGGHQTCRKLMDEGAIGHPVAATVFMQCHGHEHWHPDPGFYYTPGGGPLFDMGPYYLTALINLLGPVRKVQAFSGQAFTSRRITSAEKYGENINVEVPTHVAGTLEFKQGALVTLAMSFDVWGHNLPHMELHGTEGSLSMPDPNTFGGPVRLLRGGVQEPQWQDQGLSHGNTENSRGLGVLDMARAMQEGRPHRASGALAYHVLDVMQSLHEAADTGKTLRIKSTCKRPAPLKPWQQDGVLTD